MLSTTTGIVATQSLLYAIGLGAGSIPMAAGLNWIIKDGLGDLGGILYVNSINTKFDSNPKLWSFISLLSLAIGTVLEIFSPYYGLLFIPIAALANMLKNISWMSTSASRTVILKSFASKGNLADLTAKCGSQIVCGNVIGTSFGVVASGILLYNHLSVLMPALALIPLSLYCCYKSLKYVTLNTLDIQRGIQSSSRYVKEHKIYSPQEVNSLYPSFISFFNNDNIQIHYGESFDTVFRNNKTGFESIHKLLKGEKYLISIHSDDENRHKYSVHVLLEKNANTEDEMRSFLQVLYIYHYLNELGYFSSIYDITYTLMKAYIDDYRNCLIKQGWDLSTCYFEEKYARIDVL